MRDASSGVFHPATERDREVALLAMGGGALIIGGFAFTSLFVWLFPPPWGGAAAFVACEGVPNGIVGALAIAMGFRALRGHAGSGTLLFLLGLVALVAHLLLWGISLWSTFSVAAIGLAGSLLLMASGVLAAAARTSDSTG